MTCCKGASRAKIQIVTPFFLSFFVFPSHLLCHWFLFTVSLLRLPSFAVQGDLCRRRLIPWWVAAIVAHNSLARTSPRREFCVACASQSAGLQCPRLSQMLRCGSIRSVYTWGRVYSSSSPAVALLGYTVWHRSAEPLCWTRGNVGISRSKSWVL